MATLERTSNVITQLNEASYWIIEMISGDISDAENQHIKNMIDAIDQAIEIIKNPIDLFEFPELLPQEVTDIIEEFGKNYSCSYEDCDKLIDQLNAVGYTCEYGLDSSPYNLTKLK